MGNGILQNLYVLIVLLSLSYSFFHKMDAWLKLNSKNALISVIFQVASKKTVELETRRKIFNQEKTHLHIRNIIQGVPNQPGLLL